MMSHENIVKPWETGLLTLILTGVRVNASRKRETNESFLTRMRIDYFILASVQRNASHQTVLITLGSFESDNVRFFLLYVNYFRPEEQR